MASNFTLSIIGIGRLGGALAIALDKRNYKIENLVARNLEKAEKIAQLLEQKPKILSAEDFSQISSDVILIAAQDAEVEAIADKLAREISNKPIVFHTSGSLSSEILHELKSIGCSRGSIHPLVSVSDSVSGAERFANCYFCVEGDAEAVEIAKEIVETLGGKSFSIATEHKALYHASAVTVSGHFVALVDAGIEMLTKCGVNETDARKILLPLIESTVENLNQQNASQALTGTFARADVETFEKHLKVLSELNSPELLEIYLILGNRSLGLAEMQGAKKENIEKMRGQISLAKKNLKC